MHQAMRLSVGLRANNQASSQVTGVCSALWNKLINNRFSILPKIQKEASPMIFTHVIVALNPSFAVGGPPECYPNEGIVKRSNELPDATQIELL